MIMTEKYGILKKGKPQFPVRKLLMVPHQGGDLIVAYPFFGPGLYKNNVSAMNQTYSYQQTGEPVTFKEWTASEAISVSVYGFGSKGKLDAKRDVFDPRWLQAGVIVRTAEGVYATVHRDGKGNVCTDESELRKLRDKATKLEDGIWILENSQAFVKLGIRDFGFASYETFDRQKNNISRETFVKGGLARVLEHTSEKEAKNLKVIASSSNYKKGVSVWGFDEVKQPRVSVCGLESDSYDDGGGLFVGGDSGVDDSGGCASGVVVSELRSGEVASKN